MAEGDHSLVLDVAGSRIELRPAEAARLRDAASAEAGRSTRARDLSFLLNRGPGTSQVLALTRSELRLLARLAENAGLADLAARLRARER